MKEWNLEFWCRRAVGYSRRLKRQAMAVLTHSTASQYHIRFLSSVGCATQCLLHPVTTHITPGTDLNPFITNPLGQLQQNFQARERITIHRVTAMVTRDHTCEAVCTCTAFPCIVPLCMHTYNVHVWLLWHISKSLFKDVKVKLPCWYM